MLSLLIVAASIVVLCNAVGMGAEPVREARDAAKLYFSNQLHALATAGYASRKPANQRTTLVDYASGGFLVAVNAADPNCNRPALSLGLSVHACNLAQSFSYMFRLAAGADTCEGGVIQYFSDEQCTESAGFSDLTQGDLSCTKDSEVSPFTAGKQSYTKFMCSTSAMPRLAVTSAVLDIFANNVTDCGERALEMYVAFSQSMCWGLDDNSARLDCTTKGEVVWDHYTSPTDCTGKFLFKESIKEECELSVRLTAGIDADDDRGLFNPPPSISTTPFTPSGPGYAFNSNRWHCTPASKLVTLSVTQVVTGFTVATFNTNPALYTRTFVQAIVACMDSVLPENIVDFVVTDNDAAARQAPAALLRTVTRLLSASDSVQLAYTVAVVTSIPAEKLQSSLSDAISGGQFTTLLQQFATENGATALTIASSHDSVIQNEDTDDDDAAVLSTGAIIGIAVGGFVFIALIVSAVLFLCCRPKIAVAAAE